MGSRFDLSWDQYPHDGASSPLGVSTPFDKTESDELFHAWCQERHESIELKLCLDEALSLLRRIIAAGEVTPESRLRAKRLLRTIRESRRADREDQD